MKLTIAIILLFGAKLNCAQNSNANAQMRSFELLEQEDIYTKGHTHKFTINVLDRVSQKPLENIMVKLYANEHIHWTQSTKRNGICTFNLINGSYGIIIQDSNYQFFMNTVTIGNDDNDEEFIYLYPKKGVRLIPISGTKLE